MMSSTKIVQVPLASRLMLLARADVHEDLTGHKFAGDSSCEECQEIMEKLRFAYKGKLKK